MSNGGASNSYNISNNYRGNPNLPANQSDEIPEKESCSVWITHLPPDCNVTMLLGQIRGCDKVFATVVNEPQFSEGKMYSAAKVVFWSRQGVDRLLQLSQQDQFIVGYNQPLVRMNRIRSKAARPGPQSRVLHITGPVQVVNVETIRAEFEKEAFTWQDDMILVVAEDGKWRIIEWRFGSYRFQSQNACTCLNNKVKKAKAEEAKKAKAEEARETGEPVEASMSDDRWWSMVQVSFGFDPCA